MTAIKKGQDRLAVLNVKLNKNRARSESDLGCNAQSTRLCLSGGGSGLSFSSVYSLLANNSNLVLQDKAVIECQLMTGARISQVLRITHNDISPNGIISVRGSKGSNSVLFIPQLYREFWLSLKRIKGSIGMDRDRFYYYRLYRKLGLYDTIEGNVNTSVTHSIRHVVINETSGLPITERERANFIGHKSVTSQNYYITSKRHEIKK